MKNLLVVYHSQTGHTETLINQVVAGARTAEIRGVQVRLRRASQAAVSDLLWAHGLVLGTPENFGYMSGAMKDFLDRVYYPCEGLREGLPYALVISAGNDGTGARSAVERIARGFPLKAVHDTIIVKGEPAESELATCREMGMALAAGLELGVF